MSLSEVEEYYPKTKQHLRKWLGKNHLAKDAVWLIFYKKHTGKPTVNWTDAVDEALCFGWIDRKGETIDDNTFRQYFCKRKPNSTWSKINKQKIENLISKGLMTAAGLAVIEVAKLNGSWTILDEVEELTIPNDLEKVFSKHKGSNDYFLSLNKSARKMMLSWIVLAKTQETRQKRIDEIVKNSTRQQTLKQF